VTWRCARRMARALGTRGRGRRLSWPTRTVPLAPAVSFSYF